MNASARLSLTHGGKLQVRIRDTAADTVDMTTATIILGKATGVPTNVAGLSHTFNTKVAFADQLTVRDALAGPMAIECRYPLTAENVSGGGLVEGDHVYVCVVGAFGDTDFLAVTPAYIPVKA